MKRATVFSLALLCAIPCAGAAQLVRGQVVDSISGAAVPQSTVVLVDSTGAEADRTVSDAGGYYLLRAPRPGRYQLTVEHEAYRRSLFPPFDLAAEMRSFTLPVVSLNAASLSPDRVTLALAAARCAAEPDSGVAVIVGVVSDATTGDPVAGAQVYHAGPDDRATPDSLRAGRSPQIAVSDGDGIYAVCDAPLLSRIAVHAVGEDRTSAFQALLFTPGGVVAGGDFHPLTRRVWRQDLQLLPAGQLTASLTGAVTDTAGNAVPEAIVQLIGTPYQTSTDLAGRFAFTDLAEGPVRVQARRVGFAPAAYDVELAAGESLEIPGEMLAMGRLPLPLADITVVGELLRNNPRLSGFFQRRDAGVRGRFATRNEWQTWTHYNMSSILNRMRYTLDNTSKMMCSGPPSYFLDGSYLPFVPEAMRIDDVVDPSWIDAIEAYGTGFDAPARFQRNGCAPVILIWTSQ